MIGRIVNLTLRNRTDQPGKITPHMASIEEGRVNTSIPHDQPRASSHVNDNYFVTKLQARLIARNTPKQTLTVQSIDTHVRLNVLNHAFSATGPPQRKGISPGLADVKNKDHTLKYVKAASSVSQLSCVQSVVNVPLVAKTLPIGSRLQNFWQTWAENSSNTERGLHPPLSDPAKSHKVSHSHKLLCQSPQEQLPDGGITSAYRQKCRRTSTKSVLPGVFQLFFVPKPNNKWRPILDLSKLNLFLKVEKFKMETLETIRTSLQKGSGSPQ